MTLVFSVHRFSVDAAHRVLLRRKVAHGRGCLLLFVVWFTLLVRVLFRILWHNELLCSGSNDRLMAGQGATARPLRTLREAFAHLTTVAPFGLSPVFVISYL